MTLEILIVFLLIIANGVFAMSEAAIISARKVRLQHRLNEGDARAGVALELANAPSGFLSAVQVGITLVGVLNGAFGGVTIAKGLATRLRLISLLAPYSEAIGFGIVVLSITYLSLVIGELVPKQLALNNPEQIASTIANPMRWLARVTSPIVRLLSASTGIALRLIRVRPSSEPPVTEDEIKLLIEQGTQAGVFEEAEQDMVAGVFRLGDRHVGANMTPRTEVVWLDPDDSLEEIRHKIAGSGHSRFPVCRGNLDNILGLVQAKDLLACCLAGQSIDLEALLQHPPFVPESMPALKVMELFKDHRINAALVVGEYGGLQGIVTINDILEAVVGDISLLDETAEPEAIQREDGSWLLDGMLPMDEFKEIFQVGKLPGEEKGYYQTVGGFVMTYLERIPSVADRFEWGRLSFEVVDMDGLRVDKVLVRSEQGKASILANDV